MCMCVRAFACMHICICTRAFVNAVGYTNKVFTFLSKWSSNFANNFSLLFPCVGRYHNIRLATSPINSPGVADTVSGEVTVLW